MATKRKSPPKPISQVVRPEITRLPVLTVWRRLFRRICKWAGRLLVWLFTIPSVQGLENYPRKGPFILVTNHLGDADGAMGLAFFPVLPDTLGKAELYHFPLLGWIMRAYGIIWLHRGQADRRALRAALEGLSHGRIIGIAPEGRESLTGALEEGTHGAAYLAIKSGAPILPVAFTGTENRRVYTNLKRLRRTPVSMRVGPLFNLGVTKPNLRDALAQGTEEIMIALAELLPPEYQGFYREARQDKNGR